MKRLLLPALFVATFFGASSAQAQTRKAANTSVAPTARPATDWQTPADAAPDDPMMHSSGVLVAPGMSSSPYRGTSTDYMGRPVAKAKSMRPRSVQVASTDPMMHSSGVMVAPGMSSSPYRTVSTDYWGRPLKQTPKASVVAKTVAKSAPVAAATPGRW